MNEPPEPVKDDFAAEPKSPYGAPFDGRYQVLSLLRSTEHADIYKAEHLQLHRIVDLKILQNAALNDEQVQRFNREARLLADLRHENILAIYGYGIEENLGPYLVLECLDNPYSLAELLQAEKSLSWRRAAGIAVKIAETMEFAHQKGVLHRDLRPENIILLESEGPERVKIADFSLAKAFDGERGAQQITASGQVLGSLPYLSPELRLGELASVGSDVYSLGVLLYQLLSGRVPEILQSETELDLEFVDGVGQCLPERLKLIIKKSLAYDSKKRFASMKEFAGELGELLAKSDAELLRTNGRFSAFPEKNKLIIVLAALALVSGMVLAGFLKSESKKSHAFLLNVDKERHGQTAMSKADLLLDKASKELESGRKRQAARLVERAFDCLVEKGSVEAAVKDNEKCTQLLEKALNLLKKADQPVSFGNSIKILSQEFENQSRSQAAKPFLLIAQIAAYQPEIFDSLMHYRREVGYLLAFRDRDALSRLNDFMENRYSTFEGESAVFAGDVIAINRFYENYLSDRDRNWLPELNKLWLRIRKDLSGLSAKKKVEILGQAASLLDHFKQTTQAEQALDEAASIADLELETDNNTPFARVMLLMAFHYQSVGQKDKEIQCYYRLKERSIRNGNDYELKEALKTIANLEAEQK